MSSHNKRAGTRFKIHSGDEKFLGKALSRGDLKQAHSLEGHPALFRDDRMVIIAAAT